MRNAGVTLGRLMVVRGIRGVSARHTRRATVLFVVTIVIAMVSLAAYGFVVLMQTEHLATRLRGDQLQVAQIADSGLEYLTTIMSEPPAIRQAMGGVHDNPALFQDVRVDARDDDPRHGRFSIVSAAYDFDGAMRMKFGVHNECDKLHLGTVLQWDAESPGRGREALLNIPGMTTSIADAILDWIDGDDEARQFGAETDYYLSLRPARRPANEVPVTLEELLNVRGVTASLLCGLDRDRNFVLDESELARRAHDVTQDTTIDVASYNSSSPWTRFLTVHSAELNQSREGENRIDLNQSNLARLHQELAASLDQTIANFVVAMRIYGTTDSPASNEDDFIPRVATSRSASFEFESQMDLVDARVGIPTGSDGERVYASPFSSAKANSLRTLVKFCDITTTQSENRLTGRINANTAPKEVLLAIPHWPEGAVEQIISTRAANDPSDIENRGHPVWLFTEGIVDAHQMKRLLPVLTAGGDVVSAQIVGYYDDQSPWMRFETIIDATSDDCRSVFYKDLRRLGRGLMFEQLAREAQSLADRGRNDDSPLTHDLRKR